MIDWLVTATVLLLGISLMASGLIVWLYIGFFCFLGISLLSQLALHFIVIFWEKDK